MIDAEFQVRAADALLRLNEDLVEVQAKGAAQMLLLEVVYTTAFAGNAERLRPTIDVLVDLVRSARTGTQGEDEAERMRELQARVAAHLERFGASVASRLARRER